MALQSIGGGVDVSELKVQYEKTKDGTNWTKYSKEIDGKEIPKVCLLLFLQGFQKKNSKNSKKKSFTADYKAPYNLSRRHRTPAVYHWP